MTKEELLKSEYSKLIMNPDKVYAQNPSIIQAAHTAMDEYAKQQAIAFGEFMSSYLTLYYEDYFHRADQDKPFNRVVYYKLPDLYNKFLNTL